MIEETVKAILATKPEKITVLYHANCTDGFGSAWAAYKAFGDKPAFIPARHQKFTPASLAGDALLICDFSFKLPDLLDLQRRFKHILVLDHHIGAEKDLKEFGLAIFDNNRSGAGITWDTLHPGKRRPILIDYIEDRDLWRRILKDTDEISALNYILPPTFEAWDAHAAELENNFDKVALRGSAALSFKNYVIDQLVTNAKRVSIDGEEVLAANCPTAFKDEVANILAINQSFAAVWSQAKDGSFMYSLRSEKIGGADVGKIAAKYGGGGHRNSAAFVSDEILE